MCDLMETKTETMQNWIQITSVKVIGHTDGISE